MYLPLKPSVFLVIYSVFFGIGCEQKAPSHVENNGVPIFFINHHDVSQLSFEEIAEEVVSIQPEMTANSMIRHVADAILTDQYLYILDLNQHHPVLQFDRKGNFIRHIGITGEGPGEFGTITSMAHDAALQQLYFCDPFRKKVLVYSEEGDYLEEITGFESMPASIFRTGSKSWILEGNFVDRTDDGFIADHFITLIGEDHEPLARKKHTIHLKNGLQLVYRNPNFIFQQDTVVYFFIPTLLPEVFRRDTLYQITEDHDLKPVAKFPFQEQTDDTSDWVDFGIRDIQVTPTFFMIHYTYKKNTYLFLYNKDTEEGSTLREGFKHASFQDNQMPISKSNGKSYFVNVGSASANEEPNPTIHWVKWK
ncbi:6-bladed beta-propeller [Negadavirga shengliensis]|uniref:6-bladed beta-propeller n=1 Tax=Negadavirga shengliensis TaxID=1389218 RepID=A0ABV9T6M6_9BACT